MTNGREKGKKGELEVARILRERGYKARRGQQYCGISGDADVIGLPGFHIEVKRAEQFLIKKWREQAMRDAQTGEVPIVVFRESKAPWKVLMDFSDFLDLLEK